MCLEVLEVCNGLFRGLNRSVIPGKSKGILGVNSLFIFINMVNKC